MILYEAIATTPKNEVIDHNTRREEHTAKNELDRRLRKRGRNNYTLILRTKNARG